MSDEPFRIIDVSDWAVAAIETSGAEAKCWLIEPDTEQRWLFKSVTIKDAHVHGEDWAEKAVSHLGDLLGVPCAKIEMAEWSGSPGCIGKNLCPKLFEMHAGQVLLEERKVPGYVHRSKGRVHPGHSLENIQAVLVDALPPPGCDLPFDGAAFDIFAGYVLLDAWIANRDRHDNNWSVLRPLTTRGGLHLSGSYDHASSLGFNVPDAKRVAWLAEPGRIPRWCTKGLADRFAYDHRQGRPTLVDVAAKALRLASPAARDYWLDRLGRIRDEDVRRVVWRVPRMSDPARTFAVSVLDVNRRRVLDACT